MYLKKLNGKASLQLASLQVLYGLGSWFVGISTTTLSLLADNQHLNDMKIHSIAITLLISTAVSSFSPPCFKTRPHHAPLPGQAASSTDATKETELEKQRQHQISGRKWGQKMKYSAKKTRPFANLSFDELKSLTEYHLSQKHLDSLEDNDYRVKETSSRQVHEIKKLISSWSKLASAGYMNSGSSNDIDSNVIMLTKKEKSVAAEMAERCLKTLVDEEKRRMIDGANSSILSMDLYHSVRIFVTVCQFN